MLLHKDDISLLKKTLFPDSIQFALSLVDINKGKIYKEEEKFIKNAVRKRKAEFITGRILAKEILLTIGIENFPLLIGKSRQPLWPKNISGTISHSKEYCMVAVCENRLYKSIGMDVESVSKMKAKLFSFFCTDDEIESIQENKNLDQNTHGTIIFSAKESFYKLQYPLTHNYLSFKDAKVTVHNDGNFDLTINQNIFKNEHLNFKGKYLELNNFIFTSILYN